MSQFDAALWYRAFIFCLGMVVGFVGGYLTCVRVMALKRLDKSLDELETKMKTKKAGTPKP